MARPVRLSLIALAILAALLAIAMLLGSRWARELLEERISQRLEGREVEIGRLNIDWGWSLGIQLEDVRIANASWAEHENMLKLDGLDMTLDVGQLLRGNLGLQRLRLEQPVVHLARRGDGTANWDPLKPEEEPKDGLGLQPDIIQVRQGQLTYRDAGLDADVSVAFDTADDAPGKRRLEIRGQGDFQGRPLEFSAVGGPPSQALVEEAPYAITLQGHLGQIQIRFDGQAQDLSQFQALQGQLGISAPATAELAQPLARSPLEVPAFDMQAQVSHEGQCWALKNIDLQAGESHLTGSLAFEQGQIPRFDVQLRANRLDLNRWGVMDLLAPKEEERDASAEPSGSLQERLARQLEPLYRYRGQLDVSIDRLSYGETMLRDVVAKGRLGDGRLQIERLHAVQGAGELSAQGVLRFEPGPLTGSLEVELEQMDLGRALAPLGFPELGTANGELHASLSRDALTFGDTELAYNAPAQELSLQVRVETEGVAGVQVKGHGSRNGVPLRFDVTLGPLLELFTSERPYKVQGALASRETRLTADGTVIQPLQLAAVDTGFSIEGPDPARLNALTGLDLPALPGYEFEGQLTWEDPLLRVQGLRGQLGESDTSGDIRLRLRGHPMLWATLHSRTLNLDDLRPLSEVAIDDRPGDAGVFSDEPWNLAALRKFDAKVNYRADDLNARDVPLQGVDLEVTLDRGVMTVDLLQVGVGGGKATGRVTLNAHEPPLDARLDLSITGVNLKPLLRRAGLPRIAKDTAGVLGGKVALDSYGGSMDTLMANLNGQLELAVSGGRMDWLLVELLGLDAGEALVRGLADQDEVPMQCAYVRFAAEDGLARLERFFIATTDSNFTGGGTLNLATERLDLVMEAHPKDVSVFSSDSPVKLQGSLGNPQVSVTSGELLAHGVPALSAP